MIEDRPLELRPVLVNENEVAAARRILNRYAGKHDLLATDEARVLRSIIAQYDQGELTRVHD